MEPQRISPFSVPNSDAYRSDAFQLSGEPILAIVIRSDAALSVSLAYGRASDTAADEGTASSASLPFKTAAQACASADTAEGGTYLEFDVPPQATLAQWVFANSSGGTAAVSYCDFAPIAEEDPNG